MFRTRVAWALAVLVVAGCQESHRPVVREVRSEPEAKTAPIASPRPSTPEETSSAASTSTEVDLGLARLTAPAAWVRKAPRVEFIRAEFALPRAEGDSADGRLTVSVARGGLKDNLERWRSQFGGKPDKESQETIQVEGIEVTLVDFSGTYQDQMGPFAPGVDRSNYRMLGAIFELGGELHFVKAYGPAKTMETRVPEFRAFVQSLKLARSGR